MARVLVRDAVLEYVEEAESRGLSAKTVRDRRSYLSRFAAVCDAKAKQDSPRWPDAVMAKMSTVSVNRFFSELAGGAGNKNQALFVIRHFLRWSARADYITAKHMDRLLGDRRNLRYERKMKYYLDPRDFDDALEFASEHHPESRAIVALAMYTLCRQSEIAGFRLKDLSLAEQEILAYRRKLKRHTNIGVTPELYREMTTWLSWYADHTGYASPAAMMTANPDWYLVPRREGRRYGKEYHIILLPDQPSGQRMRVNVTRVLEEFGVEDRLGEGMHTIRRSGARALFDYLTDVVGQDKALLQVQTMLDHDRPEQTLTYIGRHIERDRLNDWLKGNSMYGRPSEGARRLKAIG